MPWPPSTDVLVASGVGAAVLIVLIVLWIVDVVRRRARRRAEVRRTVADAVATGMLPRALGEPDADPGPGPEPAPADPPPLPQPVAAVPTVAAPDRPDTAGSGGPLAAALNRALTSRPAPRGDARDRLLAVLLDDPARTVGAAAALEASSAQLSRLTAAVSHERDVLGAHLAKLVAAGLQPEQLASLAGLPASEIRDLLAR
ncbi:hypothetical protein ACQEVB_09315 [Pseudonocardia sp. CA-107938]|uniref:hypothetical protein n=1 Tax=Pseudonocardia sp. CA-107938 TaxID=3240021 RepID=UPI003D89F9A7